MDKPKVVKNFQLPRNKEEMQLGPKQRAGILLETNAGWRIEYPVVDHSKCTKCELCWIFCPEGVIDRNIEIDMDYCKGCALCVVECPKDAISMMPEVK